MSDFELNLSKAEDEARAALEALQVLADRLDQLDAIARSDGTLSPPALGVALFHLSAMHEAADKQVKRMYHVKDGLSKHVLPERMRATNIDGFRVPEIARSFSIIEKTSASFVDKDAGLAWLREIGQGDMIQETVNAGTLASFCRNMVLEQGFEPPPDLVRVSTYSTTGMAKYRPKKGEL